jgi:hypothetical protein
VIQPALGNGDTKGHVHEVVKWPATVHARRIAHAIAADAIRMAALRQVRVQEPLRPQAIDQDIQFYGAGETAAMKSPQ